MRRAFPLLMVLTLLISEASFAEAPMNVDDAGTLNRGGMKGEGAWNRDATAQGAEFVFGFSPIENFEVGIAFARDHDHGVSPSTRFDSIGGSLKWVPVQNEAGWSLGAVLTVGRTRVTDYVTPDRHAEHEIAINGLATWRTTIGNALHLNLGVMHTRQPDNTDTLGIWGLGYEHPLEERLKATAEIFGQEHSRPDKAIGLRYQIVEGVKLFGAIGRGNDRRFGQIGCAWEF